MLRPAQKDTRTPEQQKSDTEAFVEKLKSQETAAIERLKSFRERLKNKRSEKGDENAIP